MNNMIDRLLLFSYSLIITVISGAMGCIMIGFYPSVIREAIQDIHLSSLRMVMILLVMFIFFVSIRFFYLSISRSGKNASAIAQHTDIGEINISMQTIENVALKAASRVRGTKDVQARIRTNEAGIVIKIRLVVDGETIIPTMTEEVQRQVQDYVQKITGFPVANVSIYVTSIVQKQAFKARVE